ncbi:hypothetical protein FG877_15930 [Enterococcus casseliflavus]|nr:hypothetical protein [Enterococcus casseliflavus]
MRKQNIESPEAYLEYFQKRLVVSGQLTSFPKLLAYYNDLAYQFTTIYENHSETVFSTWRQLLAINAKLQILLDLYQFDLLTLIHDCEMTEEDILKMIQTDYKSYYRELLGYGINEVPRWGLIFLSEE